MNNDDENGFFLERLDAFLDKSLSDIAAFATRESKPLEEIRCRVAEWHCKYLFNASCFMGTKPGNDKVQQILHQISDTLQNLCKTAGKQSFFLVVDPATDDDDGFLGGTVSGREFWRGIRGGGSTGVRSFKDKCRQHTSGISSPLSASASNVQTPTASRKTPSSATKAELYDTTRALLRAASGNRQAEMKWTKHENLEVYGVRITGWPPNVQVKNPSQMTSKECRDVLDLIKSGAIHFERLDGASSSQIPPSQLGCTDVREDEDGDISWALVDDIPPVAPASQLSTTSTDQPKLGLGQISTTAAQRITLGPLGKSNTTNVRQGALSFQPNKRPRRNTDQEDLRQDER